jgi:hypothetical protein
LNVKCKIKLRCVCGRDLVTINRVEEFFTTEDTEDTEGIECKM